MKILVVEDDALFREVMVKSLKKAEHDVTVVSDGEDAVIKARTERFDLLITDLFMPKKEGLEVIQEIKALLPGIKVIAISSDGAAGHTSFLKIASAVGADFTLQKPFKPDQLLEKVGQLKG